MATEGMGEVEARFGNHDSETRSRFGNPDSETTSRDSETSRLRFGNQWAAIRKPEGGECQTCPWAGKPITQTLTIKTQTLNIKQVPASQPQSAGFRVYWFPETDGFRIGDPGFRIVVSESGTLVSESWFPNRGVGFRIELLPRRLGQSSQAEQGLGRQ